MITKQQTLFALDCGATNWRLYRSEYSDDDHQVQLLGEPQAVSLTSFVDRKLPAVICLNPEGTGLESYGEVAQQQLDDEQNRERVREYFKPCIGSHLETNPLPHQKRYTHAQALAYTRMLLQAVVEQIRQEKWRSAPFDNRIQFALAYPVHWRFDHEGVVFNEFERLVYECLGMSQDHVRFVAEPEGAILHLQRHGLLNMAEAGKVVLIIDIGGSTTDIIAGEVETKTGKLDYLGRYGEPFGGGLYDAELAKFIADSLQIPASALADDPSALTSLRIAGQRLKESLSRQLLHSGQIGHIPQRTITLVTQNGSVYRRVIVLDEPSFREVNHLLDDHFIGLIDTALSKIGILEQNISQVILVGGGAQLFTILGHLRKRFGEHQVILADNPEEIVAQGIGFEYESSHLENASFVGFKTKSPRQETETAAVVAPSVGWSLKAATGKLFPLASSVVTIGRSERNDIQLDDIKASRFHAELHITDGKLEVIDLGSTNGTFVNGKRLPPKQPYLLSEGDEVFFGKTKFTCER
jgi:hypothetical protein